MIAAMPQGLQEKVLDTVLVSRGVETLHGFLRLYIYRYGLNLGPLLGIPYHPTYPFLTTLEMNPTHYENFSKEAYLLFWYLSDLYTIGVLFNKCRMFQYLANCIITRKKPHYKQLYKWFTLFRDVTWWQENIRAQHGFEVFATFKIITSQAQTEDGVIIQKTYEAHIQTSYNDNTINRDNFHARICGLAALNYLEESKLDPSFFCPCTSRWHNTNIYPKDFVEEIRQILLGFHDQYAGQDLIRYIE
ncbi:unnamed protein product [Arabis nemorensis]|uniref:Uncharacterized protein n=1 Tax=Arabis nemorensis TaxID=586526 RepID=A0A565BSS9_9BRAS|nr:unnamed protein product [Arabis nemorensis]